VRTFFRELSARSTGKKKRSTWVYVPYDQLTSAAGPLAEAPPEDVGIVLVESPAKAARRPYHKQKLLLVLANMRQFALEQAARGVAVRYAVSPGGYADALRPLVRELGPLTMMEAAERELRVELEPLAAEGALLVRRHAGWLTDASDFSAILGPPWRMDAFYRHVRAKTGILMNGKKPEGGKWTYDTENRKKWHGDPPAPTFPVFRPDAVTLEAAALVEERFARHPGELTPEAVPATLADAEAAWAFALRECMPSFGPFEDAMSTASSTLFHTRISPLLNLHRLLPSRIVADVAADTRLPIASREGFVRQILGWREFVRHVHRSTDGFRALPKGQAPVASAPGDGGWARARGEAWGASASPGDGGAMPSLLEAHEPLPPAYWGTPSGLACLDGVVRDVWRDGYSHHITRLMVLSNLATLLGVEPRELTDWFWIAYVDAYDWVVEPNVLAMGTYGTGDLMTTKPYVSGAAYLHKMSDYCGGCAFDPAKTCPITRLYWAFVARNEGTLERNPRFFGPVASLKKRHAVERAEDAKAFAHVQAVLQRGERLLPP